MRPSDLRHSYGTALYHVAGDTRLVKDVLSHPDTRTTERYTLRHLPKAMRRVTSWFKEHLGDNSRSARSAAAYGRCGTQLAQLLQPSGAPWRATSNLTVPIKGTTRPSKAPPLLRTFPTASAVDTTSSSPTFWFVLEVPGSLYTPHSSGRGKASPRVELFSPFS